MPTRHLLFTLSALFAVFLLFVPGVALAADEVEVSELLEKHRDNFAPEEILDMLRSRTIEGLGAMKILDGGTGFVQGQSKVYTDSSEFMLEFDFDSSSYPKDGIILEGDEVHPQQVSAGSNAYLSDFLYNYRSLVRSGLFGSVLSIRWPLIFGEELPPLEYKGIEKVDGKELHHLTCEVSSIIDSSLYFEPETFRHVRSVHRVDPNSGNVILTEDFSGFQKVENMELPTLWALVLEYRTSERWSGRRTVRWEFGLRRVAHNMPKQPN